MRAKVNRRKVSLRNIAEEVATGFAEAGRILLEGLGLLLWMLVCAAATLFLGAYLASTLMGVLA